ncbi:MAG: type I 3-dehydroquinate dehydratase [Deltaproteobacteria bacterium]|jgi:3-dehydroquinate dehydratase type I|nr:type I 3-dehydroquinate dehydratase [Deltaproteobacteria bacterium]
MKPRVCLSIGNTVLKEAYGAIDYAKSKDVEFIELRFDMIAETARLNRMNGKSGDNSYAGSAGGNFDEESILSEIKKIILYAKDKGIKTIGTNRDAFYGSNRCVSFLEKQKFVKRHADAETEENGGKRSLNKADVVDTAAAETEPEPQRIKFLKSVIEAGIDICDIELDILERKAIKDFVKFAHLKKTQVILSIHDFNGRIELLDAVRYYLDSSYFKADYFKLSDMAISDEDVLAVSEKNIKIRSIKSTDEKVFPEFIIFGMGKKGAVTRASSLINGSYLAYCSSPFGITAPGQIEPDDLYETVRFLSKTAQ